MIDFFINNTMEETTANRSPAPVKSTTLRFFFAAHSVTTSPSIATAPLAPRVMTIVFLNS